MVRSNIPKRGDVFIVDLNPVVGNEMRDDHRCVVITPREINMVGMCLAVPITTGGAFTRKAGLAVNISGHKTTILISRGVITTQRWSSLISLPTTGLRSTIKT
ncbi:MAG: type II toxin-antitoxin system PemK/MazF family toxin, partial [Pseudomonadota bacterium]|nr:type II toxin-antitoxin system PemK/MazF family toxin [Pseudomonadota bacterium]